MEDKYSYLDMAQIPYIEHEYRMFKAIERETKKRKRALIITNVFWVAAVVGLVVFFSVG